MQPSGCRDARPKADLFSGKLTLLQTKPRFNLQHFADLRIHRKTILLLKV